MNYRNLAYKSEQELLQLLVEQAEEAKSTMYDEQYQALENLEQIIYTLRNCEIERS